VGPADRPARAEPRRSDGLGIRSRIRDEATLDRLPEAERKACRALRAEVEQLARKAVEGKDAHR
jgi:hypothetical protein